jgi:hypothetical protein
MKQTPTAEELLGILGPENTAYAAESVQAGVAAYFEIDPRQRLEHTKRTRACWIHDKMRVTSSRLFSEKKGVWTLTIGGLYVLNFDDKVIVRFKKFDANRCSHGIATQQSLLFLAQRELEGIPARAPRLEFGYVLDPLETGLAEIRVAFPARKRRNHWSVELRPLAPSEVLPFTAKEPPDVQKTSFRPRFRIVRDYESEGHP